MGLAMPQCKCAWEFVPPVSPQRTWVGLTDEELREIIDETGFGILMNVWFDEHKGNPKNVLRRIEAKLKEKNT
jgi:hypothetical protein